MHAHFLCRHAVIVLHPHQKTQGEHTGHQLADIGGNGRTGHAHLASGDQNKVEDDVGDGGNAQVEQAPLGVAGGVQDTGRHVIHHAEQHAAKIEPYIEHRILQHLCGVFMAVSRARLTAMPHTVRIVPRMAERASEV